MSETLSTLIAFIGFLIVFSMLVQSFQEAIKSVLKLKSGVWESFFVRVYENEFKLEKDTQGSQSEINESKSKEHFWSKICKRKFIGDYRTKLQRLKEIIVAYDETLKHIKTTLSNITKTPADETEFVEQLTKDTKTLADDLQKLSGYNLDTLLTIYNIFSKGKIKDFSTKLENFLKDSPNFGREITKEQVILIPWLQANCKILLDEIETVEKLISVYRVQIESKYDDWMAQVDEEYRRHMLLWTVIIGLAFVLISNADSFSIYKYLSLDSKAQTTMVRMAADSTSKALTSKPEALNEILKEKNTQNTQNAQNLIKDFSASLEKDFSNLGLKSNAKEAADIGNKYKAGANHTSADVQEDTGELSRLYMLLQKSSIDYHLKGLESLQLPLGWTESIEEVKSLNSKDLFLFILRKFAGLLLTTFLITFGAPFWNDILNAVLGLKKVVHGDR